MGRWSVPGGRVEHGELLAEATVRELREETGLAGTCGGLVGIAERVDEGVHHVIVDHEVTLLDPGSEPAAGDDAAAVAWAPLRRLDEWELVDGLAAFLHAHGVIRAGR